MPDARAGSTGPPRCPECDIEGVIVGDINEVKSGRWAIKLIDGEPTDPDHHLVDL